MKKIANILLSIFLLSLPKLLLAQTPNLGSSADFVLFSSNGPMSATGINHLTGNVGTNNGGSTGFTNVNGVIHDMDAASALCAADLLTAYNQLDTTTATAIIIPIIGNGDTLIAGVYKVLSAASLNGNLFLNAQDNANAIFIFQIQGAFSTDAMSKVKLINGAQACNVFWKVEGLVDMAAGTTMRGTVIANNAAINMNAGDTLEGRALSTTGAVGVDGIIAYLPIGCGVVIPSGPIAPAMGTVACYGLFSSNGLLSNSGSTNISGDIGTNSGAISGFIGTMVSGTIHASPDVSTATTATALTSVYAYLNAITYDIQLSSPALFGHNLVLTPHTYFLNAATTLTDTLYLDAIGNTNAVFVIQINGALSTSANSRVILMNGAQAKNIYWKIEGLLTLNNNSIINCTIVVNNAAIILNNGVIINGRALTTNGNISTNSLNVIANTLPDAGIITGLSSVFIGMSITLSDTHTGGTWSSINSKAVVAGGVITGVSSGIDTIRYIVSNLCGADTATKIVRILGVPTVCVGATLILTDVVGGGFWTTSNTTATVIGGIVTGQSAGVDTIMYSVTNICGTDIASLIITVNPLPYAGSITGVSSLCVGNTTVLTASVIGGTWSSSNSAASIVDGLVTAIASNTDTIKYIVSNSCGIDTAQISVIVNIIPAVPYITTNSVLPICSGTLYQNFGTIVVPATGVTYNWSAVNATIWETSIDKQSTLVNFPNSGVVWVILSAIVSGSPCESSDTLKLNVGSSVAQVPHIFYFQSHFVCLPDDLDSYQWGYDDVNSLLPSNFAGETNQDYLNANPGYTTKYYWVNTAYKGCNQKTYYNVPLAIQSANTVRETVIEIFPNPATDLLNVSISTALKGSMQIDIVDIAGQKVSSMHTTFDKFSINVSKLTPGFYVISCSQEGLKMVSARFVKE